MMQSPNYKILRTKVNVSWPSKKIFLNANRMGALKLLAGQNVSLLFCYVLN